MMLGIVIWAAAAFGAMLLAALFAGIKNRGINFWMAWCFFVPPLVIVLMLLPSRQGPRPRAPSLDDEDAREA
jgi:hypothetical protein